MANTGKKVHLTARVKPETAARIESCTLEGETRAAAIERLINAGADAMEGNAPEAAQEHAGDAQKPETGTSGGEASAALTAALTALEKQLETKDRQIESLSAQLERMTDHAQELTRMTEQAHALQAHAIETKQLEAPAENSGKKRGFLSRLFG